MTQSYYERDATAFHVIGNGHIVMNHIKSSFIYCRIVRNAKVVMKFYFKVISQ